MGTLDPLRHACASNSVRPFGHHGAQPALTTLTSGWLTPRHRASTETARPSAPAVWRASLASILRTADTSWRFSADYPQAGITERAVAELTLLAIALRCGMSEVAQ